MLCELVKFLKVRATLLSDMGCPDFPNLLFEVKVGRPVVMTNASVNDLYLLVIRECAIPYFTSHCIRYQSESDFTAFGLQYDYVNYLLSHFLAGDSIFHRDGQINFRDFCDAYHAAVERILEDVFNA